VILNNIAHHADAIGIVTTEAALGIAIQGIHRTGEFRRRAAPLCCRPGVLLERHRDIQAFAAAGEKVLDRHAETIFGHQYRIVGQLLVALARKAPVNLGRLAVGNGVSENRVSVHQASSSQSRGLR
jgi:hypothetical protein